uniref:Uncharacterized protein n=1 Tax=Alectorobius mimon TaxID=360319 RepID=A0A147BAR8_9ACAR
MEDVLTTNSNMQNRNNTNIFIKICLKTSWPTAIHRAGAAGSSGESLRYTHGNMSEQWLQVHHSALPALFPSFFPPLFLHCSQKQLRPFTGRSACLYFAIWWVPVSWLWCYFSLRFLSQRGPRRFTRPPSPFAPAPATHPRSTDRRVKSGLY